MQPLRKQPLDTDPQEDNPSIEASVGANLEGCLTPVPQFSKKGTVPVPALKLCCKHDVYKSVSL